MVKRDGCHPERREGSVWAGRHANRTARPHRSLATLGMTCLFALTAHAHAETRPSFTAMPGGIVAVSLPTSLLQEPTIRKQLGSGLTTVVVIVARENGSKNAGGARFEIRYDLWDEVWLVRKVEFDGRADRQRIASFDALLQWWHNPTRIFASTQSHAGLTIELRVLPFSAAEEQDAREWISKSGGVATPDAAATFVQTLIATTITARPITTYRWSVDLLLK